MTANFDSQNSDHSPLTGNHQNQPLRSPDVLQRDRFEMLSAYLDGEVSADERRQVEDWLANDPTVQRLHSRLLKLRQAFQTMPVPSSDEQAVQQTVDAVLARVDRRPRLSVIWGGVAIAAAAVAAVTSALLGQNPVGEFAKTPTDQPNVQPSAVVQEEPLLIALDKPLVSISENPEASPRPNPNSNVR
ncbi:MAG: zf-HC2 domain-containing protein [Leptolyngbyaceae cyanobacterium bins.349]|nr:zf-HC2 domain-containing protein [Leptolyngbyaceae cyanobacterium bins.349]